MYYSYEELKKQFEHELITIGKTQFNRNVWAIKFGSGGVLFQGAIHAREHVTAKLILNMAEYNKKHGILKNACFVPVSNPDGVELSIKGIQSVPVWVRKNVIDINKQSEDFSLWKANGMGVDLNLNFDAEWGKGKGNLRYPNPEGYIGQKPESEIETQNLVRLTEREGYKITFSFHAKGEELYYGFKGVDSQKELTKSISEAIGYRCVETPLSVGGFKDWCVLKKKIPAYTIEFGRDDMGYVELYRDIDALTEKCINLLKTVAQYGY